MYRILISNKITILLLAMRLTDATDDVPEVVKSGNKRKYMCVTCNVDRNKHGHCIIDDASL